MLMCVFTLSLGASGPHLEPPRRRSTAQGGQSSSGGRDKSSVLQQVLASNERLRGQIGTIREKLLSVNDVMDCAEATAY
jgi:hypothetical protein